MKPTIPEVLPKVRQYYKQNPTGGVLHIVLDDGNIRDSCVIFCLELAIEKDDTEGEALARLILLMSKTQRLKLYSMPKFRE